MSDASPSAAFLVSRSTSSLPWMPAWPGVYFTLKEYFGAFLAFFIIAAVSKIASVM